MNRWAALALLLALAGALALRLPRLDARPLHNDEAVNAVRLAALWERGDHVYDPEEFHGPTLYYFSLPFLWLSPARNAGDITEAILRVTPVAFGIGLILLLLMLADGLGRQATLWAALFTAVSPAMVFYSRYFIHEMLLVFFTALALAAGWRYSQSRRVGWAVLAGAALGLMHATKETFVLTFAALALALVVARMWERWRASLSPVAGRESKVKRVGDWMLAPPHLALGLVAALAVSLILFTSFFSNWSGPLDSIRTYLTWLPRAGGQSPHAHSWYFYLERLAWFHAAKGPVWSEGLVLVLAAVGASFAFSNNRLVIAHAGFARFLVFYTVALTAIYTVIAYKTPWCLLNFYHPMILLAGIGAAALVQLCRANATKLLALLLILSAGTGHLAWQAWRAAQQFAADSGNPYVYAQTVQDARQLVERVEAIAGIASTGHDTVVKVIAPESYWPLPWYLRRFKHVGFWDQLPADPYAPLVIASAKLGAALDEQSGKRWLMTGLFEIRPGVFFELYVEADLWKRFVATLPREPD